MSKAERNSPATVANKGGVRVKAKKRTERFSLRTPYLIEWPRLSPDFNAMILSEIQRQFLQHFSEMKRASSQDKKEMRSSTPSSSSSLNQTENQKKTYRDYLAVGINAVTKALERGTLRLLLVCRSARPKHMTEHLVFLSQFKDCPACAVPRLSTTVAPLLGIRSALAIGFKNDPVDDLLSDLVSYVEDKIPPLHIPWIKAQRNTIPLALQNDQGKGDGFLLTPLALKQLKTEDDDAKNAFKDDGSPGDGDHSIETTPYDNLLLPDSCETTPRLCKLKVQRHVSGDLGLTKKERRTKRKQEKRTYFVDRKGNTTVNKAVS